MPSPLRWFVLALVLTSVFVLALIGFGGYFLLQRLTPAPATPTPRPEAVITIPEGWRREQIAQLLEIKNVTSAEEFLARTTELEGSLFPDTYRFFLNTPVNDVVEELTSTFTKRTASRPPTRNELILASIVEREAASASERPIIAGVYANRLAIGMKLDADPTVQYGKVTNLLQKGTTPAEYWPTITRADYQGVVSPFNTYRSAGLPPAPIANPGLASIQAAQQPADHDFLFFVHRNGELRLAKTLAEHERNAAR
jgi:UPF0755 protein